MTERETARLVISKTSEEQQARAREVAIAVARALDGAKCEHIVVLDVRELSQVTSYIVIGSGTSDRQIRTAAISAEEAAEEMGEATFRSNRNEASTWVVADFIDVVAHIFEPNARAHYDLEMLWDGGPEVEWRDPKAPRGARAMHSPE